MNIFLTKLPEDRGKVGKLAESIFPDGLVARYKTRQDKDRESSLLGWLMLAYVYKKELYKTGEKNRLIRLNWEELSAIASHKKAGEGIFPYEIVRGENGKPGFANSDIHFNISHSGNMVLLAVSSNEIGADIQLVDDRPAERLDKIAAKVFDTEIKNKIANEKDPDKKRDIFYRNWTLREAVVKREGRSVFSIGRLDNTLAGSDIFQNLIEIDNEKYWITVVK